METIFHGGEIWDQYTDWMNSRQNKERVNIPLYALCHNATNNTWWIWYHSWNNVTDAVTKGQYLLSPTIQAYLLLLGINYENHPQS